MLTFISIDDMMQIWEIQSKQIAGRTAIDAAKNCDNGSNASLVPFMINQLRDMVLHTQ